MKVPKPSKGKGIKKGFKFFSIVLISFIILLSFSYLGVETKENNLEDPVYIEVEDDRLNINDDAFVDAKRYLKYEKLVEEYEEDDLIQWVWEKCKDIEKDNYFLECINAKFSRNFNYEKSPSVTFLTFENDWTSDCEGATAYYLSLSKLRGLKAKPIHTEGHIFAIVEYKNKDSDVYCILDQKKLECF